MLESLGDIGRFTEWIFKEGWFEQFVLAGTVGKFLRKTEYNRKEAEVESVSDKNGREQSFSGEEF